MQTFDLASLFISAKEDFDPPAGGVPIDDPLHVRCRLDRQAGQQHPIEEFTALGRVRLADPHDVDGLVGQRLVFAIRSPQRDAARADFDGRLARGLIRTRSDRHHTLGFHGKIVQRRAQLLFLAIILFLRSQSPVLSGTSDPMRRLSDRRFGSFEEAFVDITFAVRDAHDHRLRGLLRDLIRIAIARQPAQTFLVIDRPISIVSPRVWVHQRPRPDVTTRHSST